MNREICSALALVSGAFLLAAHGASPGQQPVRVTGTSVNLRASPSSESEVVAQVSKGDVLLAGEGVLTNWVPVSAPENVDVWVHEGMVGEGVVTAPKLQVRAGPGINYRTIGKLEKGDKVVVRGQWREWLKIVPPANCRLWISAAYLEPLDAAAKAVVSEDAVRPPMTPPSAPSGSEDPVFRAADGKPPRPADAARGPEPAAMARTPPSEARGVRVRPETDTIPHPVPVKESEASTGRTPGLEGKRLVPGVAQGKRIEYSGILRSSGFIWQKTGEYRLTGLDDNGRSTTICYLQGLDKGKESLLGQKIRVEGLEYWVQGTRFSIVVVESIDALP